MTRTSKWVEEPPRPTMPQVGDNAQFFGQITTLTKVQCFVTFIDPASGEEIVREVSTATVAPAGTAMNGN